MPSNLLEISGTLTSDSPPIQHEGAVLIKGNVESNCMIVANQDIEIIGDAVGSKIKSLYGSVIVRGGIKGISSTVTAGQNVEAQYVQNANIKAYGNITIMDYADEAHMTAKKSIHIEKGEGRIEGGEIEAGQEIIANEIGSPKKTNTTVKLTNFHQADLYGFLIKYEKEAAELSKQIQQLEKIIEVIKILGARVVTLPLEKKQELAAKVKLYNELIARKSRLEDEKKALYDSEKNNDELDRVIIAKQSIFEGVSVCIDRVSNLIQSKFEKVILYKKGIIIVGNFDEFMKRKKYA